MTDRYCGPRNIPEIAKQLIKSATRAKVRLNVKDAGKKADPSQGSNHLSQFVLLFSYQIDIADA